MFFLLILHLTYRCNISFLIICNLFNEGNSKNYYNLKEYTEENKVDNSGVHTDLKNIELKLNNNLLLLSSSIDHLLV